MISLIKIVTISIRIQNKIQDLMMIEKDYKDRNREKNQDRELEVDQKKKRSTELIAVNLLREAVESKTIIRERINFGVSIKMKRNTKEKNQQKKINTRKKIETDRKIEESLKKTKIVSLRKKGERAHHQRKVLRFLSESHHQYDQV